MIYLIYTSAFHSQEQYHEIYSQFKKDESDLNEKKDKTEYDNVKEQLTTSKPLPPCPASYSSHINTSKEETQVTNVNKIKKTNTNKTNNGK